METNQLQPITTDPQRPRYHFLPPESLEKMLTALEAGDAMSRLESLSVRRNDRRVELAVRMLMRVKEAAP